MEKVWSSRRNRQGTSGKILTLLVISWVLLPHCQVEKDNQEDNSSLNAVNQAQYAVSSAFEEIAESLNDINKAAGSQSVARLTPQYRPENSGWDWNGTLDFLVPPVRAADFTLGCLTIDRSDNFFSSGVTDITVLRDFNDCNLIIARLDGSTLLKFENLTDGRPQPGSSVARAPSLATTREGLVGNFRWEVRGLMDETITHGELSQAVAQKISYSDDFSWSDSDRSGTIMFSSNVERTAYFNEEVNRNHTVLSDLTLTVSGDSRVLNGTVEVDHKVAGITTLLNFEELSWLVTDCYPASGTASVKISGEIAAEGNVVFTDAAGEAEVTMNGESSGLTLARCLSN